MSKTEVEELERQFQERTKSMKRAGMVCASCLMNDRLHSDLHGTFCQRCGPSYPLKRATPRPRRGHP